MAMILNAFMVTCVGRLTDLIEEKVVMELGVENELRRLMRTMERIKGVLEDAERRRIQDSTVNIWLNELKDIMYDADDIIDDCRFKACDLLMDDDSSSSSSNPLACCRLPSLSCFTGLHVRHEIGGRIKSLNARLEEISKDKLMLSFQHRHTDEHVGAVHTRRTSPLIDVDVVGREIKDVADNLVKMITTEENKRTCVLAVVGMAGIGKTTLAQEVFNNPRIANSFNVRIWICVSRSYSEVDLIKEIIRSCGGDYGRAESMAELQQILTAVVTRKRYFLVLDDMWKADVWNNLLQTPFQTGAAIGRILVTTRDQNVAKRMGAIHIHQVKLLSTDSGWELLCKRAYLDLEEVDVLQSLVDVGIQIVEKCHGLPLMIKVIAGLLATKDRSRREWEKILRSDAWCMSELPEEFRGALYLSYEDLPSHLKQWFLYYSLTNEEDLILDRWDSCRLIVAEGFVNPHGDVLMEEIAEEYIYELCRRSLLQLVPGSADYSKFKLHNLVGSLAKYLSLNESINIDRMPPVESSVLTKVRRMSMKGREEFVVPATLVTKFLRTLILVEIGRADSSLFLNFKQLHVLLINDVMIEGSQDFIGELIHLRYLDLDRTNVSKIPETIGHLTNLQFLHLKDCKFLHTLPRGITRLCNLRRLGIQDTPLTRVPKGIGQLQVLNDLEGFLVSSGGGDSDGWDLAELVPLKQLRWLSIDKLERATSTSSVLANKCYLRKLELFCTPQTENVGPSSSKNIKNILENLLPPPSLEDLILWNYFGHRYPTWIANSLPNLTWLALVDCISCPCLPPLGQLPHLKYLKIVRANSVVTIGPELLGSGQMAFPRLEFLIIEKMPNWEEWNLGEEDIYEARELEIEVEQSQSQLLLLSHLKELTLKQCPRLRALPGQLKHATMLQRLYIEGAHSLTTIENFPCLSEWLGIKRNRCLEKVSNLNQLKELNIIDSPAVCRVQNLNSLQSLYLVDEATDTLPEWVSELVRHRLLDDGIDLALLCNVGVIEKCLRGCQDWHVVELFSNVSAFTNDRSAYLEYTKIPFSYKTNLVENRFSDDRSEL